MRVLLDAGEFLTCDGIGRKVWEKLKEWESFGEEIGWRQRGRKGVGGREFRNRARCQLSGIGIGLNQ